MSTEVGGSETSTTANKPMQGKQMHSYCSLLQRRTDRLAQQAAAAAEPEAAAGAEAAQLVLDSVLVHQRLAVRGKVAGRQAREQDRDNEAAAAVRLICGRGNVTCCARCAPHDVAAGVAAVRPAARLARTCGDSKGMVEAENRKRAWNCAILKCEIAMLRETHPVTSILLAKKAADSRTRSFTIYV